VGVATPHILEVFAMKRSNAMIAQGIFSIGSSADTGYAVEEARRGLLYRSG
jgi:hypothetical protein